MRRGALLAVLAAVCVTAVGAATRASREDGGDAARLELAPGFENDVVASGLTAPTAFAFLPDGRILVAEQAGVVRLVDDGEVAGRPFLDIRDHVNSHYERGLLGLAVDPDYAANGLVYLLYTYENEAGRPRHTKTARLTTVRARGDVVSDETETVLLGRRVGSTCRPFPRGSDCIPNEWIGHSVGDLAFAGDGTLFVSIGDASSWNAATSDALRSQDLDSLAGKLLHVTRDGKGVPTNPFWNGDPDAARSKVWAYGLRNPFRFALSPADGTPYVGDVGWETFEEIDVAPAGANLGWPCYEGNARQAKYERMAACRSLYARGGSATTRPLVAWSRGRLRASSIGGSFNTGSAFPPVFDSAYFYGDFVRGVIQYVHVDHRDRLVSGPWRFATGTRTPVDIQFGPDGALYYLSVMDGELRRIRFTGGEGSAPPGRLVGQPAVFPAGRNPHSVTAVDIDRDGVLDLVAANAGGDDVAVLLGLNDGGFAPAAHYATGRRPKVAIAVDVDGDGSQDLVSANQDGSSVSILVGNGDATFGRAVDYRVCSRAHDVAAGDLDGDGELDLAVACFDGSVVSVLRGNGDGTFRQAVDHDSGDAPHSVVMRDFDGDGRLDLAVANHGSDDVAVLLGKGDATFEHAVYDVGSRPHAIEAADLDGDGHLDLVTANDASDDVSVLIGEGDGTFADAVAYPAGSVPKGLAVADVNGDGREDVVTANTGGNYDGDTRSPDGDTVSVLLGSGDGRLGAHVTYVAGRTPFSVTVADLDGDGVEDLATANWHGGTVSVIPGRRRG